MSYHEELPVIQTSNSLWNYWNEEESKFPDVYFTACKSGYILADTGYLSHAEYEYKTKIPWYICMFCMGNQLLMLLVRFRTAEPNFFSKMFIGTTQ